MSSNDRSRGKAPHSAAVLGTAAVLAACVLHAVPAAAALDLGALQVTGQRGQSAEQVRRDRYECHNWAVEQTDFVPSAVPAEAPSETGRTRRARRGNEEPKITELESHYLRALTACLEGRGYAVAGVR